jgi:hypothetical protein
MGEKLAHTKSVASGKFFNMITFYPVRRPRMNGFKKADERKGVKRKKQKNKTGQLNRAGHFDVFLNASPPLHRMRISRSVS